MTRILINNEALDLDADTLVTFKKAQQLNGIQGAYSFSNNFNLKDSAKNRRLLGINYLPNSKAKSMVQGYEPDVVLNGSIFLKRQKLKVQKETPGAIPVYLIFTDSYLAAKAKAVLMNQIDLNVNYTKDFSSFIAFNGSSGIGRTAPISAQDKSGLVVVEEVPILLNVKELILRVFTFLGYAYTGDILTDANIGNYYTSPNVGVYGLDGKPRFADTLTAYDFILDFLKMFNGYIEVSDSSRSLGLYFWCNIETIKSRFVDYSDKYASYREYSFEGGLAKVNTMAYADSPDFYNGFFNNNKSIVDKTDYLKSDFGAGNLRLFADQTIDSSGTILAREEGETTEPQTMNLFRFEESTTNVGVYYARVLQFANMRKAFSPNILEIWQLFHQPYTANIALPTIAQLSFRYDAIFLANFKMSEVFFVKQLSTYWLPLELNFNSKKDDIKVKCLMIEKTPADVPIVFDQNLKVGFYGDVFILDINALYSAQNVSPAASMTIVNADLTRNAIFINGVQVLAFPTNLDVSTAFELKVSNIETENIKSNSGIIFRFTSEDGGVSREATINVAHNGRANFLSEFRSAPGETFHYGEEDVVNTERHLNYSAKITTPINIADTFAPAVGDVYTQTEAVAAFKILQFDRASFVDVNLLINHVQMRVSNRGGKSPARVNAYFVIYKNGNVLMTVASFGAVDRYKTFAKVEDYSGTDVKKSFSVLAGDSISFAIIMLGNKGGSSFDCHGYFTDVIWKFSVTE